MRHTYDAAEDPRCVSFFKKRGRQSGIDSRAPTLYSRYPIAIKQAKADDLRVLVSRYVPAEHQLFTLNYLWPQMIVIAKVINLHIVMVNSIVFSHAWYVFFFFNFAHCNGEFSCF